LKDERARHNRNTVMPPPEDAEPPPEATRKRSRDDTKRETREALITAGIAAFSAEGIDAPSLDSICARAGYTRGAFYVHFKDRDEFLGEVMTTVFQNLIDLLIATGDAALDLEKTVQAFVSAVKAGMFPISGGMHMHQFAAACARSPMIRARYVEVLQETVRRVAAAVREGQTAGTVRADVDATQIATLLVGMVVAVVSLLEVDYPMEVDVHAAALMALLQRPG
jgi:TetR/AcrR family transcriptional repressor of nem operon